MPHEYRDVYRSLFVSVTIPFESEQLAIQMTTMMTTQEYPPNIFKSAEVANAKLNKNSSQKHETSMMGRDGTNLINVGLTARDKQIKNWTKAFVDPSNDGRGEYSLTSNMLILALSLVSEPKLRMD